MDKQALIQLQGHLRVYIIELTDTKWPRLINIQECLRVQLMQCHLVQLVFYLATLCMYAADGRISNVTAGTQATDAVNLAQLNQAIADNGQHHVSINSKNPANENNMEQLLTSR